MCASRMSTANGWEDERGGSRSRPLIRIIPDRWVGRNRLLARRWAERGRLARESDGPHSVERTIFDVPWDVSSSWSAMRRVGQNVTPSTHAGLLRGIRNLIAECVGFRFRTVFGGGKRDRNSGRGGVRTHSARKNTRKSGVAVRGTRRVFPGEFCAWCVRRIRVLKKSKCGKLEGDFFASGGENAFWNGARRSHTLPADAERGVACGRVGRRATRRDSGGSAIRSGWQNGASKICRGGEEVRQEPDLLGWISAVFDIITEPSPITKWISPLSCLFSDFLAFSRVENDGYRTIR